METNKNAGVNPPNSGSSRPSVSDESIPIRERWLYRNKEALAKVQEGLGQARAGEFVKDPTKPSRPVCWLCKKPIKGKVHLQGGSHDHPAHKGCLVTIDPRKT